MSFFNIPIHFLLVHFPIGLALTALIFDYRGRVSKNPELHQAGYRLTLGAALTAALSTITGLQLLGGRTGSPSAALHAAAGLIVTITWVIFAVIRYAAHARQADSEVYPAAWLALEVFAAAAVVAAAITGHRFALGQ